MFYNRLGKLWNVLERVAHPVHVFVLVQDFACDNPGDTRTPLAGGRTFTPLMCAGQSFHCDGFSLYFRGIFQPVVKDLARLFN